MSGSFYGTADAITAWAKLALAARKRLNLPQLVLGHNGI
jgi:hypothetical protein